MERRKRHRSPWKDLSIPLSRNECILDRRSDAPVMLACFCCSYHNILVACSLSVVMLDVMSPNRQETSASSLKKVSVCCRVKQKSFSGDLREFPTEYALLFFKYRRICIYIYTYVEHLYLIIVKESDTYSIVKYKCILHPIFFVK